MAQTYIAASTWTQEDEGNDEQDATTAIDEMDIDELKASFSVIMGTVVTHYGDDREVA